MPRWWAVFFGVWATALASAETLRLATYNLENYTLADRLVEGTYRRQYPKPEAEKAALRAVIRALQADILVVQEVGGRPYLEELRDDLRGEGIDYPHLALGAAADADRQVGVLSRRPLTLVRVHTDLSFKYFEGIEKVKRGLLEVRTPLGAAELTIFAVHLKSRYTDRPDDPLSTRRRSAEAIAVRNRVLELFPEPGKACFVILGDMNDARGSSPLRHLSARGKTSIATLLPAGDSRGEVWTHHYAKEDSYSRVDHLLASSAALPYIVEARAQIYDGPGVSEASDHRPVTIVFSF